MTDPTRPLALVTGASSGIGYELARVFALHGFDLIVASEDDGIICAASDFETFGAQVQPVRIDLATYEGVEELNARVVAAGQPLEAAAINAGVGVYGEFAGETQLADEIRLIRLNVESSVHLAKYVVTDMMTRHRGRILFTSAIAGTMPTPLEAVYGASKAFLLSFAESLCNELKDTGVTVTVALPGPTDTNFYVRAGMEDTRVGTEEKAKNNPDDVAAQAFAALMSGKERVVPATAVTTKIKGMMSKYLPEDFKAEQHRKMVKPGSGKPRGQN